MCGIVGLFLKDPKLEPQLGAMLTDMLITMTDRGRSALRQSADALQVAGVAALHEEQREDGHGDHLDDEQEDEVARGLREEDRDAVDRAQHGRREPEPGPLGRAPERLEDA